MAAAETTTVPKTHKSKDSTKKSSSKKRRHQDQQEGTTETEQQAVAAPVEASPTKRQRTSTTETDMEEERAAAAAAAAAVVADGETYVVSESDVEQHSPFVQQTTTFYLPLAPVAHRFPLQGLCAEHLSPLLLTYYPPLRGIVLAYSNPRLSSSPDDVPGSVSASEQQQQQQQQHQQVAMAKSIAEYAASFVWLTADFTLLRPVPGSCIEGHISLQNESYLGLVCWNFFNAAIDRKRLPAGWTWVGDGASASNHNNTNTSSRRDGTSGADWMRGGKHRPEESDGHFVDAEGNKVEGMLRFRVKDYESAPSTERDRGFLSIEGTLLSPAADKQLDADERAKAKAKAKGRRLGRPNTVSHSHSHRAAAAAAADS